MGHVTAAGRAIEADSFAIIDREVGDSHPHTPAQWPLVRRLIHTSGDFALSGITCFHPGAMARGSAALARGAPILVDVAMIAAGLSPQRLARHGNPLHQLMGDPEVQRRAQAQGTTKAVQAMRLAMERGILEGAVVGIGNAPTALLELIRLMDAEGVRPALVVGMPVGFVKAAESKEALAARSDPPWIITQGPKGGSTLVVAALHALLDAAVEPV